MKAKMSNVFFARVKELRTLADLIEKEALRIKKEEEIEQAIKDIQKEESNGKK